MLEHATQAKAPQLGLMNTVQEEIAATAARMVVEEGLEYGPAKRRAVKQLGLNARAQLPNNDQVEDAVRK